MGKCHSHLWKTPSRGLRNWQNVAQHLSEQITRLQTDGPQLAGDSSPCSCSQGTHYVAARSRSVIHIESATFRVMMDMDVRSATVKHGGRRPLLRKEKPDLKPKPPAFRTVDRRCRPVPYGSADLDVLLQGEPNNPQLLSLRGLCLWKLDRPREAWQDFSASHRIAAPSSALAVRGHVSLYRDLAVALRDRQDSPTAQLAAKSMRELWVLIPESDRTAGDYYNRACIFALSIDIAEKAGLDEPNAPAEEDVAQWRIDAIEALKQSQHDTAEGRQLIRSDSDLDSIRNLPEFQRLLEDNESPD
jgi:hypothetical protein